jgi:hypothetical protein
MGYFKDDLPNGLGVILFSNGEKYEGEVKNGYRNGTGTYYYNDLSVYCGEFVNNLR